MIVILLRLSSHSQRLVARTLASVPSTSFIIFRPFADIPSKRFSLALTVQEKHVQKFALVFSEFPKPIGGN
jgi:hypothetical protein